MVDPNKIKNTDVYKPDDLDELFDKYGDKTKHLFGTADKSYDKNEDVEFISEDLYIKKAMRKESNKNKKWYEVFTGVSEVDRFVKLLEACEKGIYVSVGEGVEV